MRYVLAILICLSAPQAGASCLPLPDQSALRDTLLGNLSRADTFKEGETAMRDMWVFFRTAPDETAQEMLNAGLGAIRIGDWITAVSVLKDLVAYCPEFSEGHNQLAFAYFLREEDAKAEVLLKTALALEPKHFGALSGLGLIYLRGGKPALGQIYLRQAVDLNPWMNERFLLDAPAQGDTL